MSAVTPPGSPKQLPNYGQCEANYDIGVKWYDRPPMTGTEKFCALLFYSGLALTFSLGFSVIGSKNVAPFQYTVSDSLDPQVQRDQYKCPDDMSAWVEYTVNDTKDYHRYAKCLNKGLQEEAKKCLEKNKGNAVGVIGSTRRLGEMKVSSDMTVWDVMADFGHIPGVLLPSIVIVAGPIVWGTLAIVEVMLVAIAILPTLHDEAMAWPFMVMGVVFAMLAFLGRARINKACVVISQACRGIRENPSIILTSCIVFIMYGAYLFAFVIFILRSGSVKAIDGVDGPCTNKASEHCCLTDAGIAGNARLMMAVTFMPTIFFLQNAVVIVCTCGIAGWYLHHDDPNVPSNPAMTGFKWAFTKSSGASYVAALVMYLAYQLKCMARSKLKYCSPLHMVAWILNCCLTKCLEGMSRFMLISHTFQGGSIWEAGKSGFNLLKKHIGNLVVTGSITSMVLGLGTCALSCSFGFAAWFWFEEEVGDGILKWADKSGNQIIILLLVWVMLYAINNPILFLIIIIFLGNMFKNTHIATMFGGMFVGCVACILFRFFSEIVTFCVDAMFYCFAVEAEEGQRQEQRFNELYTVVSDQVKESGGQEEDQKGKMVDKE